jgi:hypothetical protein
MLKSNGDLMGAVDVYSRYPIIYREQKEEEATSGHLKSIFQKRGGAQGNSKAELSSVAFDDGFIFGEVVTILMKNQSYDDPRLTKYLIFWARLMGIGTLIFVFIYSSVFSINLQITQKAIIEKYINILDKANKTKVCKEVYCGVHKKNVDDPELVQFFKFKGWF